MWRQNSVCLYFFEQVYLGGGCFIIFILGPPPAVFSAYSWIYVQELFLEGLRDSRK